MNDFLEKTLETIIIENKIECMKRGFPFIPENAIRQFRLDSGKIIDIYTETADGGIAIFELKKDILDVNAAIQAIQYKNELHNEMVNAGVKNPKITVFLVGSDINGTLLLLVDAGLDLKLLTYSYAVDGIRFAVYKKFNVDDFMAEVKEARKNKIIATGKLLTHVWSGEEQLIENPNYIKASVEEI
jgi:hypothetical protein